MGLQCIKEQCWSPVACGGFGFCREVNLDPGKYVHCAHCGAIAHYGSKLEHNGGCRAKELFVGGAPAVDYVIRYVPTYLNKHGQRTLMRAAQGRNTFATEQEAQEWIEAVTRNNSNGLVTQIWGTDPQFAVRPCKCWPGHFDPKSVYFDD